MVIYRWVRGVILAFPSGAIPEGFASEAKRCAGECPTDEESIARIVFAIVLGVMLAKPFVTKILNATVE